MKYSTIKNNILSWVPIISERFRLKPLCLIEIEELKTYAE